MTAKKVAKATGTDMARPDFAGTGRGSEGVKSEDVVIPRLSLIQDLSPQRKKNNAEYIEGADTGMMFNTVTGELYEEGVTFVPVFFRKEFTIWKDRDSGGGFRGAYPTHAEAIKAKEELEDGDLCDISETAQQFGLLCKENSTSEQIVISMSRSQLTPSRQLNSLVLMSEADRWARKYVITSKEVDGAKGAYQNYNISPLGWVDKTTYDAGTKMYESVVSGTSDVSREGEE